MNKTIEKGTTSEYVQQNWKFFAQTWKNVTPCIRHYEKFPDELRSEKVGVDAYNSKERLADRDVSTVRVAANPNPNKNYSQIMARIRQLQSDGLGVEAIQLEIGAVSFNGAVADFIAIQGIAQICRTGLPIFSSWGLGAPDNQTRQPDKTLP